MTQNDDDVSDLPQPQFLRLIRAEKFPLPIRAGLNRIGFRQTDIARWLAERPSIERPSDEDLDDNSTP